MDGRGGCCIARYSGGGAYDMSKMDRIMLRFRPIAPKPATSGSVSGRSTPEIGEHRVRSGRGKRKNVRDNGKRCNNNNGGNKKRKSSPETKTSSPADVESVVTLPLLPETPDPRDSPARAPQMWLSFDGFKGDSVGGDNFGIGAAAAVQRPARVLGSCVTVECVTDTWVDGNGLGCTDGERRMNLGRDTCPGFISDGYWRVTWTNGAFRKMIGSEHEEGEMVVWLDMKERVAEGVALSCPAFTCRVRLQYMCGGKEKTSLTLPCDVWRMSGGGFAWRLDVKAALCLGR